MEIWTGFIKYVVCMVIITPLILAVFFSILNVVMDNFNYLDEGAKYA